MAATNLRFIILGDDRASGAFNRFARQVDQTNKTIAKNQSLLNFQSQQAQKMSTSVAKLSGDVTGFNGVMGVANSKSGLFARGLAGLNLATGLLEPQVAALIVGVGGLASVFASGAIGLGAYSLAARASITKVTAAMTAQAAYAKTKTPAALAKYQQALKQLNPQQLALLHGIKNTQTVYKTWADRLSKPVLTPLVMGLKLVKPLLNALSPAVRATSAGLKVLIQGLSADINGGGFARWIRSMRPEIFTSIVAGGRIVINVLKGLGGILQAFAPTGQKVAVGLEHLSARFAQWGQTLTGHSGFQQLMAMVRKDLPFLRQLFINLAVLIKNTAGAMAGLATPANSTSLLRIATQFSGLFASLSKNKTLVQTVLYFLAVRSAVSKVIPVVGGFQAAFKGLTTLNQGLNEGAGFVTKFAAGWKSALAATSEESGLAGTLGGKMRDLAMWLKGAAIQTVAFGKAQLLSAKTGVISMAGGLKTAILGIREWTIWSKIAAVATKVWAGIQAAFNLVMDANPIALVIIAVAALIAGVILAYHKFKWFRDFVKIVGHDIAAAFQAVVSWFQTAFIPFFTKTVPAAWHTVWDAAKTAWHGISDVVGTVVAFVRRIFATMVDQVLGLLGGLIKGAAALFGWLPGGIGKDLKNAAAHFDEFRKNVNNSLLGINNRHVSVGVNFTTGTIQAPGTHTAGGRGATGGMVRGPGSGTSDTAGVFALSNKEFVHNAAAVQHYGDAFMYAVNARRYPKSLAKSVPGLATGGHPGDVRVDPNTPSLPMLQRAVMPSVLDLAKEWAKAFGGPLGIAMARLAVSFVHRVPYVWGGSTPAGWDCSGMTSWVMGRFGFRPPRVAAAQQAWARPSGPQVGALAFFAGADGTARSAGHVGIYLGGGNYVSAYDTAEGTVIKPVFGSSGAFGGFGVPRRFGRGGWIREPTLGIGLRSGRTSMYGEAGPEYVAGGDMVARLDTLIAGIAELISAVDAVGPAAADGIAAALGGAARSARHAAYYGAG